MIKYRKNLVAWLFEVSQKFYITHFKKKKTPWGITKKELLQLPDASFGFHLGTFLDINGFELIPKVERHDAYHVLTGYGTNEQDEIALQYLCFGNGKRSMYGYGVVFIGTMLLPEYLPYYLDSYTVGKKANHFHDFDYSKLLHVPIKELQYSIFSTALRCKLFLNKVT